MGVLRDFDLQPYIDRGATVLIETGAGTGTGINYARTYPFKTILSCEIDGDQAAHLNRTIGGQDPRVKIHHAPSHEFLAEVLATLDPATQVVYFLDAHFPGADLGKAAYDAEKDLDLRLPLERELDLIRPRAVRDVVICDDLRIYEEGSFTGGNLRDMGLRHLLKPGTAFLEPWVPTHRIVKSYKDTGYILLEPLFYPNLNNPG